MVLAFMARRQRLKICGVSPRSCASLQNLMGHSPTAVTRMPTLRSLEWPIGDLPDAQWFQQWNPGIEGATVLFYRVEAGILVRFPGIADFRVSSAGDVIDYALQPDSGDRWRAIYHQQVLPLLDSIHGAPAYHGAAVAVGDRAIAFLGPSGQGKSTLTAAFARRGYPFLSDDCLRAHPAPDGAFLAEPHADFIRLWDDSLDALAPAGQAPFLAPGSPKPQLEAGHHLPHCTQALPLARVYVLGDGEADAATLIPIAPAQAAMMWTRNAFVLDIKSPTVMARSFDAAAKLAASLPMRYLDYPRRYEALDEVVAAVLADLEADPR